VVFITSCSFLVTINLSWKLWLSKLNININYTILVILPWNIWKRFLIKSSHLALKQTGNGNANWCSGTKNQTRNPRQANRFCWQYNLIYNKQLKLNKNCHKLCNIYRKGKRKGVALGGKKKNCCENIYMNVFYFMIALCQRRTLPHGRTHAHWLHLTGSGWEVGGWVAG